MILTKCFKHNLLKDGTLQDRLQGLHRNVLLLLLLLLLLLVLVLVLVLVVVLKDRNSSQRVLSG